MESKLTSLLTVLSTVIITLVGVYLFTGSGYAIELAIVSLLALGAWLRFSFRQLPSQDKIVAPYILAIVLTLILSTCRYWSEYALFLNTNGRAFFANHFTLTDVYWLILFVVGPVSLMLLGGHFLSKRQPLGFYMAWWTFFYGIAEALLQYKVELALAEGYSHRYYLGSLTAIALLVVGVIGCQRLLHKYGEQASSVQAVGLTDRQVNLWTILFFSLAAVYAVSLASQAGLLPVGVVVGSMMGGLIGWRKTTARHSADPYKVAPLYLLLLCFFYVHIGEEAISPVPFNQAIASITGKPWSDSDFTFLIALIGPAFWVLGAWSLWLRQPFGNYILWFMIVGMILGEPTHFLIFPVVAMNKFGIGYQYFSGMYTALFPMIPAILSLVVIIQDHKQRLAHSKG